MIDDYIELFSSFIPEQYKVDLGRFATSGDAEQGWTAFNGWWWYKWDYTSQVETGAFTNTSSSVAFNYKTNEDLYSIFIKTLIGINQTSVSLYIDGDKV
jgi:hypothetical protein